MTRRRDQPSEPDPIGELYALPLPQFTAARNALATSLRRDGKSEEAERVRSLGRPSVSAWAVNHLYWHERSLFDQLISAGEEFRIAQQAQLAGKHSDLVPALDKRRDAIAALTKAAARALHGAGHNPTPDMMRRITTTLEALATYGNAPEAPPHGRLMADVPPPGFEALAALVPRVGSHTVAGHGTRRVLSFGDRQNPAAPRGRTKDAREMQARDLKMRRAEAESGVKQAERELRDAKTTAQKSRDAMKGAASKASALERTAAVAAERAEKATTAADAARREARKAAEAAETAVQALQDAEATLERAREKLKAIDKS